MCELWVIHSFSKKKRRVTYELIDLKFKLTDSVDVQIVRDFKK